MALIVFINKGYIMTVHYYHYWGKIADSLKKAYCTNQPLEEIRASAFFYAMK